MSKTKCTYTVYGAQNRLRSPRKGNINEPEVLSEEETEQKTLKIRNCSDKPNKQPYSPAPTPPLSSSYVNSDSVTIDLSCKRDVSLIS